MTDKISVERADLEALLSVPWVVALADWKGLRAYLPAQRVRESLGIEPRCEAKWHPGPGTSQWGCWKAKGHDGDHRVEPTRWTEPVEP